MKKLTLILLSIFAITTTWAQQSIIWEKPATAFSPITSMLSITKVEFTPNSTIVSFHFKLTPGEIVGFPNVTCLMANEKEYKATAMTVMNLNEPYTMPASGEVNFTMSFAPLPIDTKSFSFNMPGAFSIDNIHNSNATKEGIFDTYWRNNKNGNWFIGFSKNKVVYNNKIWDIISLHKDNNAYCVKAKNNIQTIEITIEAEKSGNRNIKIGNDNAECSLITTSFLPDYPNNDNNTIIANNNYQTGDSVTIIGWLKDMSQDFWNISREFSISYSSLFTDKDITFSTQLDSLGFFVIRFPVENTQMLYCDWHRSKLMLPVEPNETYFILKDFSDDKTLIMGSNARLQNEYIANHFWFNIGSYNNDGKYEGIMNFLTYCNNTKLEFDKKLSAHYNEHPTLSARYKKLNQNILLASMGCSLMQARFDVKNYHLPAEYINYVTTNCWQQIDIPYTAIGNNYNTFFRDFAEHTEMHLPATSENILINCLYAAEKLGVIKLSNTDKSWIDKYVICSNQLDEQLQKAPDSLHQQLIDSFNSNESVTYVNQILRRQSVKENIQEQITLWNINKMLVAVDSLCWTPLQRDIFLSTKFYKNIDATRTPLSKTIIDYANANIHLNAAKQVVFDINNKYEAIGKAKLTTNSIKNSDNVKGINEGVQIIHKLIEPYQGKLVLVDVWGTWCNPCKIALKHSQEMYNRLKNYPIVYLYLANRSPNDSWENIIKEYNIVGDNVVHYNLPMAQQSAIENYLGINSYPSYRLFDQQGNLLNINANPHDIDAFEGLIKRILNK